ncbi:MAG: BCCT family transporter, partial [Pseudomonadales bacterium]|nr:BCCT family transporter [Pseudomonadales bacterium]
MSDSHIPSDELARFNPPVFFTSTILLVLLVISAALFPTQVGDFFQSLQQGITVNLSWYYVFIVALILIRVTIFELSPQRDNGEQETLIRIS